MSTFTLAISCLTASNLPWFMDLTFQVPMQYCSLQHWTLLLSPVTSTAGCCFCFGSILSFFLELFLHWSPVAYWHLLTWGVPLLVSYHFAFSYYSWGSQSKNTEVVCHSLLQWTPFCQASPLLGASMGDPTHDKVMRRGLMGKASQVSGVPPEFPWASTPPKNRICPPYCTVLFHSSDTLWKKLTQGFSLLHLTGMFQLKPPLITL